MGFCDTPAAAQICDPLGGVVGGAAGGLAGAAIERFAGGFADGFATLVKSVTTFWVDVPTPTLGGGPGSPVAQVQDLLFGMQALVLTGSLLWVAGRTALTRSGQSMGEAARSLAVMAVAVGAGVAAVDVLVVAGDAWSAWIIDRAAGGDLGGRLAAVAGGSTTLAGLGVALTLVVSLLGILSCIAQVFLLLARVAVLALLVGTLPLSAAAMATPAGKAWFQRSLGWIVAFLLYKPVAALVYAAALTLAGSGTDLLSVLSGLMLIVLAVLALPALMRLTAPVVAAASGGGGAGAGAAAAAAGLAGAARPTGSRSVTAAAAPAAWSAAGAVGAAAGLAGAGGLAAAGAATGARSAASAPQPPAVASDAGGTSARRAS